MCDYYSCFYKLRNYYFHTLFDSFRLMHYFKFINLQKYRYWNYITTNSVQFYLFDKNRIVFFSETFTFLSFVHIYCFAMFLFFAEKEYIRNYKLSILYIIWIRVTISFKKEIPIKPLIKPHSPQLSLKA